eukprot:4599076-Amphidinium_carterae.4
MANSNLSAQVSILSSSSQHNTEQPTPVDRTLIGGSWKGWDVTSCLTFSFGSHKEHPLKHS